MVSLPKRYKRVAFYGVGRLWCCSVDTIVDIDASLAVMSNSQRVTAAMGMPEGRAES